MGQGLRLVIFDCDGTLVDSQRPIAHAMARAFEAEGLAPPAPEAVRAIIGLSLPEAIAALAPGLDGTLVARLVEGYKRAFIAERQRPDHEEPLFEGVRAALDRLAALDHVLLGIATGKARRGIDVLFAREGLADYFHTVQTADRAPSKPHPAMLHQAMEEVGATPRETVMVGDTSFDMEMARNAGVSAIGVAWGYHPVARLVASGAERIVRDFDALLDGLELAVSAAPPARRGSGRP